MIGLTQSLGLVIFCLSLTQGARIKWRSDYNVNLIKEQGSEVWLKLKYFLDNYLEDQSTYNYVNEYKINMVVKPPVQPSEKELDDIYGQLSCQMKFQETCLRMHNKYRFAHKVPGLNLDGYLHASAYSHASILAETDQFEDSELNAMGKNIAYSFVSNETSLEDCERLAERFVDLWYNEKLLFDFDRPKFSPLTGHFTQIVWKSTTDLGCGVAISKHSSFIYAVCHYNQPGNVDGQFQENVLPQIGLRPKIKIDAS